MTESLNTTIRFEGHCDSVGVSFYEYPTRFHSTCQLTETITLPTSNRDELINLLELLTIKTKTLENERKKAEHIFQDIKEKSIQSLTNSQDFHIPIPSKSPTNGKNKQNSQQRNSNIPFILGKSTTPSHNVKSNIQTVIALLKSHNHQLCLSSKDYIKSLHPHKKNHLSSHQYLYLDHYKKSSKRNRSIHQTPKTNQYHGRIEQLLNEYIKLFRQQTNSNELNNLNQRMELILNELESIQNQEKEKIPLETSGRSKLFQLILKDSLYKQ